MLLCNSYTMDVCTEYVGPSRYPNKTELSQNGQTQIANDNTYKRTKSKLRKS